MAVARSQPLMRLPIENAEGRKPGIPAREIGYYSFLPKVVTFDFVVPAVQAGLGGADGAGTIFTLPANTWLQQLFVTVVGAFDGTNPTIKLDTASTLVATTDIDVTTEGEFFAAAGEYSQTAQSLVLTIGSDTIDVTEGHLRFVLVYYELADMAQVALLERQQPDPVGGTWLGQPYILVLPASLDLGDVMVNELHDTNVVVYNVGYDEFDVTALSFSGPDAADWTADPLGALTLPETIVPGGFLVVELQLAPLAGGASAAVLTIDNDSANDTSVDRNLAANVIRAEITPDVANYDYGQIEVNYTSPGIITFTNAGDGNLVITALDITGDPEFTVDPADLALLPITVAPGLNVAVTVIYAPLAVGIAGPTTLDVTSNALSDPLLQIDLFGEGVDVLLPVATPTPAALDFGQVTEPDAVTLPVNVENTGDDTLVITVIEIGALSDPEFTVDLTGITLPLSLQPAEDVDIPVTFTIAAVAAKTGTLEVTSNDAASPLIVNLTGEGV